MAYIQYTYTYINEKKYIHVYPHILAIDFHLHPISYKSICYTIVY